jgi:hypothetical protein
MTPSVRNQEQVCAGKGLGNSLGIAAGEVERIKIAALGANIKCAVDYNMRRIWAYNQPGLEELFSASSAHVQFCSSQPMMKAHDAKTAK